MTLKRTQKTVELIKANSTGDEGTIQQRNRNSEGKANRNSSHKKHNKSTQTFGGKPH